MITGKEGSQVFNLVKTSCDNYANCKEQAWGIVWKPTNGGLYISNRTDWFTTESARDAAIQQHAV